MTEEQLEGFFKQNGIKATINHYEIRKRTIYYTVIGNDHLPAILFIHGVPASMVIYKDFFTDQVLLNSFSIYAVDRPGFGLSGSGHPEPSIQKQAEMILPLAERIHRVHQPLIIVAGSYGASIACKLVMEQPGLVQGLILLAPSLGPGLEKMYWITPLLEKTFLRKFVSAEFRSASKEKYYHKRELEKLIPFWKKIAIPVFYLQSEKDPIIYPSNADFAKQHLGNVPILKIHFFPGRKHNIDTKQQKTIRNKILECYRTVYSL